MEPLTKTCKECKQTFPIEEFYRTQKGVARDCLCRLCRCARVKRRRHDDDSVREYDRERAKTPKRKQAARAVTIRWRAENPEKYKAQTALGNALRDKKISKKPCEYVDPKKFAV